MSDWFYVKLAGAVVVGLAVAFVVITDLVDRWRRPKDKSAEDPPQ